MTRRTIAVSAIFLILTVAVWPQKPKKTAEDGVEVILNSLKPSQLDGRQSTILLEEELRVDLARKDLVEAGLARPADMDVDAEGNIYVSTQRSSTNLIRSDGTGTRRAAIPHVCHVQPE
jgi:hypothetical protein